METELPSAASQQPEKVPALTPGKVSDALWDSAWEAVILAFLVSTMGSVVVGLVGGLWRDMAPSLRPGLASKPTVEQEPSLAWTNLRNWFQDHRFAILFVVIFAGKTAARLIKFSRNDYHRNAAAWSRRVWRRVSAQWFGLVVVNAFTAFGLAFAWQWSQAFSQSQILWHIVADLFSPLIHAVAGFLPGTSLLMSLMDWYHENQFKFTFWLLYSAAICDDLGLPNYKALARWAWRRFMRWSRTRANLAGTGS